MTQRTILVIDDEPRIGTLIRLNFEPEGYEVITARSGREGLRRLTECLPDAVILDVMMPEMDGYEVLREIRKVSTVPVVMLTVRADEADKVRGLELGADDYVTKPFSMRELVARVRALLRRAEAAPGDVLVSGDLRLDLRRREATRKGQVLPLKPKELDLLAFLMRHRGRAFSREEILAQVWGYDFAGDTRTVDVHVHWLREKIEDEPSKPTRLITLRGLGYRFEG